MILQIVNGILIPVGIGEYEDFLGKNDGNKYMLVEWTEEKQRTLNQNSALHLWFQLLAEALNDAGYDMRKVIREEIDIPWSKDTIKKHIWKPVQEAQLGKKSTTQLSTKDIDQVYDTVNRAIGQRTGIHVPFPSIDSIEFNS